MDATIDNIDRTIRSSVEGYYDTVSPPRAHPCTRAPGVPPPLLLHCMPQGCLKDERATCRASTHGHAGTQ